MTTDRLAAYLAATEPKPRGSRAVAERRRYAAKLAGVEPTPKPPAREPLFRCIDCGGLVYAGNRCRSPFCEER
jgi:hypothetical protein